ncbi:MAG: cyanophycinase [Bacteroidetes bacterium HGW-Bacteroidetes-1]|jgi:cyanophycinase|nr:MAG: cyanophycinase [Bacteroidetes bacterium HGW-Bacteroidetes-1]
MRHPFTVYLILLLSLLVSTINPIQSQGNLMIVGGGLENDNTDIFDELVRLSGGTEKAVVSVIPAASGVAAQSFTYFRLALMHYGIKPENIHLIPVAMVDDDSTKLVNEAEWINNGNDLNLAEIVKSSTCVWFSGGDQLRIAKTLLRSDGSRTPVLEAVWEVYESGGLIGGTSAGAAIMSNPMIGSGTSMGALLNGVATSNAGEDLPNHEGVLLTTGLGFFTFGMVDQHFHARARIGRLIAAMLHTKQQIAFGIDENTALVYYGKENLMKVAGTDGVTILNASNAKINKNNSNYSTENLRIHYLESGDTFLLLTNEVIPAEGKRLTNGHEYYNNTNPFPGGMFSTGNTGFHSLITKYLMDNRGLDHVESLNFTDRENAFLISLSKNGDSKSYMKENDSGKDSYTIIDVKMDIKPVHILIDPEN